MRGEENDVSICLLIEKFLNVHLMIQSIKSFLMIILNDVKSVGDLAGVQRSKSVYN